MKDISHEIGHVLLNKINYTYHNSARDLLGKNYNRYREHITAQINFLSALSDVDIITRSPLIRST